MKTILKLCLCPLVALFAASLTFVLAVALFFLRYYMTVGNDKGVLYEVVAARSWGATKAEVLDVIESGFVLSGPFGTNAAARSASYLDGWPANEPRRTDNPWPAQWSKARPPIPKANTITMPCWVCCWKSCR